MRTAVLVTTPVPPDLVERVKGDLLPCPDFLAVADALGAALITPFTSAATRRKRPGATVIGLKAAWRAFRMRAEYDLIFADSEAAGLGLAALFKAFRIRKSLVMFGEGRATHIGPSRWVRALGLQTHVRLVICPGAVNASRYERLLGFPPPKIAFVPHPADHRFWRPMAVEPARLVVSAVGQEYQDYPTLIEAMRESDIELRIAGAGPWQNGRKMERPYPANVRFSRCGPTELRELYARAIAVAVPLRGQRGGQAGSRVVYEAMAMGKAVIATKTDGLVGLGIVHEGETGLLVDPGNVEGWKDAIRYLHEHRDMAARMGRNARKHVENGLNLGSYAQHVAQRIKRIASPSEEQPIHPLT